MKWLYKYISLCFLPLCFACSNGDESELIDNKIDLENEGITVQGKLIVEEGGIETKAQGDVTDKGHPKGEYNSDVLYLKYNLDGGDGNSDGALQLDIKDGGIAINIKYWQDQNLVILTDENNEAHTVQFQYQEGIKTCFSSIDEKIITVDMLKKGENTPGGKETYKPYGEFFRSASHDFSITIQNSVNIGGGTVKEDGDLIYVTLNRCTSMLTTCLMIYEESLVDGKTTYSVPANFEDEMGTGWTGRAYLNNYPLEYDTELILEETPDQNVYSVGRYLNGTDAKRGIFNLSDNWYPFKDNTVSDGYNDDGYHGFGVYDYTFSNIYWCDELSSEESLHVAIKTPEDEIKTLKVEFDPATQKIDLRYNVNNVLAILVKYDDFKKAFPPANTLKSATNSDNVLDIPYKLVVLQQ